MTSEETKEDNNQNASNIAKISLIEWTSRCEELLYFFASHKAAGTLREDKFIQQCFNFCSQLFSNDCDIITIDNYGKQELCDSYPIKLIIPKSFITHIESKNHANNHNSTHNNNNSDYLSHLLERARYARVHRRFVIPVIFLPNNACIARSSTLSTTGELLLNKATTVVSEALNYTRNSMESPMGHDLNACRSADIKLLQYLNIECICDLMVEDKKKVGWGRYALTVTSSEKVDREHRYAAFKLSSIPYPGCEFFKRYRDNQHNGNKLVFEWNDNIHDAKLTLISDSVYSDEWSEYQSWDIIRLTQNYLRLILDYMEGDDSVLIHCISGWDRTPLFISLIRLSLWADGVIHCDLDCSQILYLTLSYDWLLFTHQLGNRLMKGEDIFHFTFYMLQFIINERYSIQINKEKTKQYIVKTNMNGNHENHPFSPPIHIMIPKSKRKRKIINNLSHSWEKKGCGPLSSNIRNCYIPTLSTPPSVIFPHNQWQFVDEKNDSPMFQFISTPKSDQHRMNNHITVPELELNDDDNISSLSASASASVSVSASVSSGDIKINTQYPPSPSPEVIAHPENNIIDINMNDSNDITAESMAKTVIHDVIDGIVMKSAKSRPVTISDFLGLNGVENVSNSKIIRNINRSDRLLSVYALFNKVYTQVMIINDAPTFYKQSMDHDCDDIDFICSEKYMQSDSYKNIATYLKSILPMSLIRSNDDDDDEYDDDDD